MFTSILRKFRTSPWVQMAFLGDEIVLENAYLITDARLHSIGTEARIVTGPGTEYMIVS